MKSFHENSGKNLAPLTGGQVRHPPVHPIRATLIRVHIEPGFPFSGSNRSPIRAPFKNNPI